MARRSILITVVAGMISAAGCGLESFGLNPELVEALLNSLVPQVTPAEEIVPEEIAAEQIIPEEIVPQEIVADEIVPEDAVTVTLINDSTEFPVRVTVAFDDDVAFLAIFGRSDERMFLIEPGDSVSFWEDCDDIRIVSIDDADLLIPDRKNEGTESALLNEGLDYECGDEIRFRFEHSARIDDFDVSVRILTDDGESRRSLQDSILDFFGG